MCADSQMGIDCKAFNFEGYACTWCQREYNSVRRDIVHKLDNQKAISILILNSEIY